LLGFWPVWGEIIWIWGWSLVGIGLVWYWRSLTSLTLVTGATASILYLTCFGLLINGAWVPFVPSILSLIGTVVVISIQNSKFQLQNIKK
jgi:CHASE2 domain-containing sensor protein